MKPLRRLDFYIKHIIMEDILVPIGICVVLPVMIVWLNNRTHQNETNRKTEIMLKAIESGATIDADFFKAQQDQKTPKTIKERLLKRLSGGCICTLTGLALEIVGIVNYVKWDGTMSNDSAVVPMILGGILLGIGISLIVVFFVGKKMLAKEMEAEAKSLEQK
jgi:hypothetical protein